MVNVDANRGNFIMSRRLQNGHVVIVLMAVKNVAMKITVPNVKIAFFFNLINVRRVISYALIVMENVK